MPPKSKADKTETHAQRVRREAADLLQNIIDAGGSVSVRFDTERGARVRVNLDRLNNAKAFPLFLSFRNAPHDVLLASAADLLGPLIQISVVD